VNSATARETEQIRAIGLEIAIREIGAMLVNAGKNSRTPCTNRAPADCAC
jgi:hypothetical protein